MSKPLSATAVSLQLRPLCPRDNHSMHFESPKRRSNPGHQPSYHCGFAGCGVRFDPVYGYYTLVGIDGRFFHLEEPGVNTMKCPLHDAWLYRKEDFAAEPGVQWCCGVADCHYSLCASTKGDWVRT